MRQLPYWEVLTAPGTPESQSEFPAGCSSRWPQSRRQVALGVGLLPRPRLQTERVGAAARGRRGARPALPQRPGRRRWAALLAGPAEGWDGNNCPPPALGSEANPILLPSPLEVATPSSSQIKVDQPRSPGALMAREELAGRLAQAIQGGDKEEAAKVAATLAQQHVTLSIQLQEACFPAGPIRLQVTVEDAASSAHVTLQVHPHSTVATLQEQVFSELGFPPAVQRWVIGGRLCMSECSLASYGICHDGDPAFLYLLSAPQEAQGRSSQHPKKMDGDLGCLFSQSLGVSCTPQLASASLPSPLQPGWSCPSCTFINTPSRPGCEMCSTQRPIAWDPLSTASTLQPPKVLRREEGLSLPGPSSLNTLLNLSRDLC